MKFLSMWWLPFWAIGIGMEAMRLPIGANQRMKGLGYLLFIWFCVNCFITVVYAIGRLLGRARRDAA